MVINCLIKLLLLLLLLFAKVLGVSMSIHI